MLSNTRGESLSGWGKLPITPDHLMSKAQEYMKRAYAPYSNFPVGAAVLMDDGVIIGGCNVENASYGNTLCAERVAMASAVASSADKQRRPLAIAVISGSAAFCPPCGMCRQFLYEFNPEMDILMMKDGEIVIIPLSTLLPHGFRLESWS